MGKILGKLNALNKFLYGLFIYNYCSNISIYYNIFYFNIILV